MAEIILTTRQEIKIPDYYLEQASKLQYHLNQNNICEIKFELKFNPCDLDDQFLLIYQNRQNQLIYDIFSCKKEDFFEIIRAKLGSLVTPKPVEVQFESYFNNHNYF